MLKQNEVHEKHSGNKNLKRMFNGEFGGKETIPETLEIEGLTKKELIKMLKDFGCFTRNLTAHTYKSHVTAVRNLNQRVFNIVNRLLFRLPDSWENSLVGRINLAVDRLHIKGYMASENTWLLTAHTEVNVYTAALRRFYWEHILKGAGNYKTGTQILGALVKKYQKEKRLIPSVEIEEIINRYFVD